ncbi:MAG: thermonuclease family protein [Candidatus Omnitrophica bacterium]|nr:thermonuclease family protein [Candidatus Omnitrophota bacterium]
MARSFFFILISLALLILLLVYPSWQAQKPPVTGLVRVERVVDGDTIKLVGGERVRLLGIDTPELHESAKLLRDAQRSGKDIKTIQKLGQRAKDFVNPLLAGKNIRLDFDIEKRDKYGRLLAYIYLEDGTFINKVIIENGYAVPLTIPPNIKHADEFKELYRTARAKGLGLWADEK